MKNKVAIVTGASKGIGRSIALFFASHGANIVLASRTKSKLESVKKEIEALGIGSNVLVVSTDVSSSKDVKNLIKQTMKTFKRIDFLINNAGILYVETVKDTSDKHWDDIMNINLKGPFLASKEVIPIMTKQKSGIIINISSGAGKSGYAELGAYCASKFGLIGLTESLAGEVEENGIKVYAVCPGMVNTDMVLDVYPTEDPSSLIQPEKIAKAVIKLCEPGNEERTGSSIEVYS